MTVRYRYFAAWYNCSNLVFLVYRCDSPYPPRTVTLSVSRGPFPCARRDTKVKRRHEKCRSVFSDVIYPSGRRALATSLEASARPIMRALVKRRRSSSIAHDNQKYDSTASSLLGMQCTRGTTHAPIIVTVMHQPRNYSSRRKHNP